MNQTVNLCLKGKTRYSLVDYPEEIWTGIEYQVASHLIYEGFIKEGLKICKGVRSRYNGEKLILGMK